MPRLALAAWLVYWPFTLILVVIAFGLFYIAAPFLLARDVARLARRLTS